MFTLTVLVEITQGKIIWQAKQDIFEIGFFAFQILVCSKTGFSLLGK